MTPSIALARGVIVRCGLVLLALAAASAVAAQDQGLDSLLFAGSLDAAADDVQARSVQLYRLPIAVPLRSSNDHGVGVRLTLPVSLSSVRVESTSDIRPFVRKLAVAAIVPGVELYIPASDGLRLRPFAEAGIGKGTEGGNVEVLYGAGLRARLDQPLRHAQLTFGGSAMYRKRGTGEGKDAGHAMFEGAVDAQIPLGFSIGKKRARGGAYAIARGFNGLRLTREAQDPIVLRSQFEAGISFATSPDLSVWKVRLPWLAAGYQFGPVVSSVRFYAQFPF